MFPSMPFQAGGVGFRNTNRDPYWAFTKAVINFVGANGSTSAVEAKQGRTVTFGKNAAISTADSTFGAGSSLALDGTGDAIWMPDSTDWQPGSSVPFCWEFVAKCTSNAVGRFLVCQAVGTGFYPVQLFATTAGHIRAYMYNSTSTLIVSDLGGNNGGANGSWHHIALCREDAGGGNCTNRVYIDGVQAASVASAFSLLFDAGAEMTVGMYSKDQSDANAGNGWLGYVQSLRYTLGHARYLGGTTFSPPSGLFPVRP